MRKLLLSAAFGLLGMSAIAQNYTNKFTHLSGTQSYNTVSPVIPIAVTVTPIGNPGNTTPGCGGTGPYYVSYDAAHTSGYRYSFSPAVTHVKFEIAEFHDDDTIFVRVNNLSPGSGPIYPITLSMIGVYNNGACPNLPSNNVQILKNGRIVAPYSGTGPGPNHAGNNTLTLTVPAIGTNYINSIEIIHPRDSTSSSGIVYNAYAAFDTCAQPMKITADSPICTGKNLNLHATYWPGATYSWTTTAAAGIPPGEQNSPDPVITGIQIAPPTSSSIGNYSVQVTRGICTYNDTKFIDIDLTPNKPQMKQAGPKCTGDNDTLTATNQNNTDVFYFRPGSNSGILATLPPTFNQYVITNIQPTDAGIWRAVVVSLRGCASDTADLEVKLNSIVKANFDFKVGFACNSDTVQFEDLSLGNNKWTWNFDDGSTLSGTNPTTHGNPLHIYSSQGTFNVKLIAENSVCKDSITKQVPVNHPLTVDFDMYRDSARTTLDDSICQGDTIFFRNNSAATPATIPFYTWDFKDGSPLTGEFEPIHKYVRYGVYDVTLKIKDYLGCEKTLTKRLVVDSLGSASFFTDTVLCEGESLKFSGDYSLIGGTYALWDFSDGHTIQDQFVIDHSFEKPGTYDVKLEAHYRVCKDTTYHQNIYVLEHPTVDLGPDTAMCPNGAPIALKDLINNQSTPGLKWRWNTHTADTTPNVLIHHPGIYSVSVDNGGCISTDTIVVKKNCYIDIPNVFTPDGDGYNDYFLPRQFLSRNVSKFSMTIYNRWGEKVFETNKLDGRGWDGKLEDKDQPQGVYVYLIKVSFGNGTNENYQGNITLLR